MLFITRSFVASTVAVVLLAGGARAADPPANTHFQASINNFQGQRHFFYGPAAARDVLAVSSVTIAVQFAEDAQQATEVFIRIHSGESTRGTTCEDLGPGFPLIGFVVVGPGTLHVPFPEPLTLGASGTWCASVASFSPPFVSWVLIVGASR